MKIRKDSVALTALKAGMPEWFCLCCWWWVSSERRMDYSSVLWHAGRLHFRGSNYHGESFPRHVLLNRRLKIPISGEFNPKPNHYCTLKTNNFS